MSIEELADRAYLNPRQFSRAFHEEARNSRAKATEILRVEVACLMMEQSRRSMYEIAKDKVFLSPVRRRRSFSRAFGQPPVCVGQGVLPLGSFIKLRGDVPSFSRTKRLSADASEAHMGCDVGCADRRPCKIVARE
jgi:AraC-like DNA-binding protein